MRSWREGLWWGPVPLGAARIWAGRALLTGLPKGSWLRALALPADAVPAAMADLAILAPARADVGGAVTVVPDVPRVALAFSAVAFAVSWKDTHSTSASARTHRQAPGPDRTTPCALRARVGRQGDQSSQGGQGSCAAWPGLGPCPTLAQNVAKPCHGTRTQRASCLSCVTHSPQMCPHPHCQSLWTSPHMAEDTLQSN